VSRIRTGATEAFLQPLINFLSISEEKAGPSQLWARGAPWARSVLHSREHDGSLDRVDPQKARTQTCESKCVLMLTRSLSETRRTPTDVGSDVAERDARERDRGVNEEGCRGGEVPSGNVVGIS